MPDNKTEQVEIAERLQLKLLKHFEHLFDTKQISSTDCATLSRLLMQNGWSIDPARVPKGLRGILTESIKAAELDELDEFN
jgi:hypothetical protein